MAATRTKTQPGAKPSATAQPAAKELRAQAEKEARELEYQLKAKWRKKHKSEERRAAIRKRLAGILEAILGGENPWAFEDIVKSENCDCDEIAAYYGAGALREFILAVKKCFHGPDDLYTVDTIDWFNRLDDATKFLWDHRRRHVLGA